MHLGSTFSFVSLSVSITDRRLDHGHDHEPSRVNYKMQDTILSSLQSNSTLTKLHAFILHPPPFYHPPLHLLQPRCLQLPPVAQGQPTPVPWPIQTSYSRSPDRCSGFLLQCNLAFEMQPSLFPIEQAKVAYITSHLTSRALQWTDWSLTHLEPL